jgi:hypothetical protein
LVQGLAVTQTQPPKLEGQSSLDTPGKIPLAFKNRPKEEKPSLALDPLASYKSNTTYLLTLKGRKDGKY